MKSLMGYEGKIPTCERCGGKKDLVFYAPVYALPWDSGAKGNKDLGNGFVRMTPMAHEYTFKCEACDPPNTTVRLAPRDPLKNQREVLQVITE